MSQKESKRNIQYFFKNLNRKHRLSLRKERDNSEVWYMHISPIKMIGASFAILLLLFIGILLLIVYTPVLNLVPGYKGNQMREEMVSNIMKLDSIEKTLYDLQIYNNSIVTMLSGKTPIIRNVEQIGDSISLNGAVEMIERSAEDSLLRSQMEGDGRYGLSRTVDEHSTERMTTMLYAPVKGAVHSEFSPKDNRYGVKIATTANYQVLAVNAGVVILSTWSPEEGYIVQVQHNDNMVSTYKQMKQIDKILGDRVAMGEVIGYTEDGINNESKMFEFRLWKDGVPINPQSYVIF